MSGVVEHYKSNHNFNIETESTGMFQPATASSSDIAMKSLIVLPIVSDDIAVTVLNNDHKKDSEPNSDNTVDVLIVSTVIAPNTTTLPVPHKDETISSKPIEVTAALDNISAITAAGTSTGSDGNEVATFPQKVSHNSGNPFTHAASIFDCCIETLNMQY